MTTIGSVMNQRKAILLASRVMEIRSLSAQPDVSVDELRRFVTELADGAMALKRDHHDLSGRMETIQNAISTLLVFEKQRYGTANSEVW